MKKIVLTGGGTAGHVYPALALLPYLKEYEIHYIGSNGMEKGILEKYPHVFYHEIPAVKLVRKLTAKNFLIPFKLLRSIRLSKKILKEISPNIIFSKGGFVAVPVVLAGKRLNIPIISHESDLSLGLANKIILKHCDKMCTTFLETSKVSPKCIHTGQPMRREIFEGNPSIIKAKFKDSKPCLLVIGGSLGASFLNKIVDENIEELTKRFNIIHLTGKENKKREAGENYFPIEFSNNIGNLYASADFAISRAGSGVINELLCLNKPMLLVPLSKNCSRGDQIENAKLFKKLGYCEMIEQEEYCKELLLKTLDKLILNRETYKKNMKKYASENACEKIVGLIKKYEKKSVH